MSPAPSRAVPRPIEDLPGPRPWPLVGNTLQLNLDRFHLDLEAWARDYGPVYQIRFGRKAAVVLADAALIRELLKRRPDRVRRASGLQAIAAELGFDGLFTTEGARWRQQRKLMNAAFAPRAVRSLEPKLIEITTRLRDHWRALADRGATVDVHADLRRYTVDVTMVAAFGEDIDTLRGGEAAGFRDQIDQLFPTFHRRLRALWPYWRVLRLPRDRHVDAQVALLRQAMTARIEATRARLEATPGVPATNLLEALILARDEDDPKLRLDDEEVIANTITILLAGEDTTSNTAAWLLDTLARMPALARRLQAEVDAELGPASITSDLDCLARMPYLQGAVNESLRLRSAAPLLFFEPLEDQELGDLALPKGITIVALTRAPACAHANFAEPARFDPARWVDTPRDADADAAHDPRALLSFGYGPRICPGRALALLELGLVGSMVARNFDLELAEPGEPEEVFGFTMSPRRVRLRLRPR